jgi:Ca2+-binding EF-hand superfamily protein
MAEADTDQDGKISRKELYDYYKNIENTLKLNIQ